MLVRTRCCLHILIAVVRNCPERLDISLAALVHAAPKHPDAAQALHMLSELSVWFAMRVRDALAAAQVMPDLALHLTLHTVRDVLDFCSASLRTDCTWLRVHFQANQERENTPAARVRGLLLHALDDLQTPSPGSTRRLAPLLHLLSGVCGMWGLRLSAGSSQRVLEAITAHAPLSEAVSEQGLCFLLVCEGMCRIAPPKAVRDCLLALLRSGSHALVLLVAVRFVAQSLALNASWAKRAARVPVSIHSDSLTQLGSAMREALPEDVLVAQALQTTPVAQLNADMEGSGADAAALAMHELMRAHVFVRHGKRNVREWLVAQLGAVSTPLHPCLADFVSTFVTDCTSPPPSAALEPVEAEAVLQLARSPNAAVRLVGALLVLQHNAASRVASTNKAGAQPYARPVVEAFSLRRLLALAQPELPLGRGAGASVAAAVTALCIAHHPELLMEELWLVSREQPLVAAWLLDDPAASGWAIAPLRARLEALARRPDLDLLADAPAIIGDTLPQLVADPENTAGEQVVFAAIWRRIHRLDPMAASLAFVSALRLHQNDPLSSAVLLDDALRVLRVQPAVLKW